MKRILAILLVLFSALLGYQYFGPSNPYVAALPETVLGGRSRMEGLPLTDAARLYRLMQDQGTWADSLLEERLFARFDDYPLSELHEVYPYLYGTTTETRFADLYDRRLKAYLEILGTELSRMKELETALFAEQVAPLIELAIDSIVTRDVSRTLHAFSGNSYKVTKIFKEGTDQRWRQMWAEYIHPEHYTTEAEAYADDFVHRIQDYNAVYFASITGSDYIVGRGPQYPTCSIVLTDAIREAVDSYTDGLIFEAVAGTLDLVMGIVLNVVSLGTWGLVYDAVTFVWSIGHSIYDVYTDQPSPEAQLIMTCAHDLDAQISFHYMPRLNQVMAQYVGQANDRLYKQIDHCLRLDRISPTRPLTDHLYERCARWRHEAIELWHSRFGE